jgi:hypothetical protein
MNRLLRPAALLAGTSLLLVACTNGISIADGVVGSGSNETETRDVEDFDRVEVGGGIVLEVTVGEATSFEITAQPNLLPILSSDVNGGTLRVRGTDSYTATETVVVRVSTPELRGLDLSGGSRGSVTGVDAASLEVELTGGSQLTASGAADGLDLRVSGGSRASLSDLEVATASVELSGAGRAELTASERVTGDASGGSALQVAGSAIVEVEASGGSSVTMP